MIHANRLRELREKLKDKYLCKVIDGCCTKEEVNEYTDILEALLLGEEALKELHRLNLLKESGRLIVLESKWILCSEDMPKHGQRVFAKTVDGEVFKSRYEAVKGLPRKFVTRHGYIESREVKAWKPLEADEMAVPWSF